MRKSWPHQLMCKDVSRLTRDATHCTQQASFTLAGILALYKSSARKSPHFAILPSPVFHYQRQSTYTTQICTMARMAAVALVFASAMGAMAQGTTCADPTVLPGNVRAQAVILLLCTFPPTKILQKSDMQSAGVRA